MRKKDGAGMTEYLRNDESRTTHRWEALMAGLRAELSHVRAERDEQTALLHETAEALRNWGASREDILRVLESALAKIDAHNAEEHALNSSKQP
jgi:hypothetical protein